MHFDRLISRALISTRSVVLASVLLGCAQSALAHVSYTDLGDPLLSPGGTNGGSFSNFGWWAGTTATLGDSHLLAEGNFFKFHLDQASIVSITFSDSENSGLLNPAFSLYRGLLADEAHDDNHFDPLNPRAAVFPFGKIASTVDNGVTADAAGRVSAFRDTANIEYLGQFDAMHNWSMSNDSGEWNVLEYITHAGPESGNSVSLQGILLGAGDYTIAAAGGTAYDNVTAVTGLAGTLSLVTTPVPEIDPATMFMSGLTVLAAAMRRRVSAAT